MKAIIDFEGKKAHVEVTDIVEAGWLGFEFAKHHIDLVRAGWMLWYYGHEDVVGALSGGNATEVGGADSLAEAIRAGFPKSCCHDCCCRRDD